MIRLIITAIFLILYFLLSIPAFLIEWILGKFNPRARDYSSLRIVQAAFKIILFISGVKMTVIGKERIPRDKAVLYIGNHQSIFDIVTAYSECPNLTGFMAKKELERIPLLRVWMRYLYCLFVDRGNIRSGVKVVQESVDHIQKGVSVFVFPEGTRNKDGETMRPFKAGSFKAAQKTGCPIVLVSINNTRRIFEEKFPRLRPAHVVLEFSEPIDAWSIDEKDYKKICSVCQERLQEMIDRNHELVQSSKNM